MGSVARTYEAASRCPTCGGSKLPPKRAISGIEEEPLAVAREGVALGVPQSAEARDRRALVRFGAECRTARQQIDGGLVVHELVLFGAPAELPGVLRARVHDRRDAEAEGVDPARIGDVDLHSLAAAAFVFVPGGSERAR